MYLFVFYVFLSRRVEAESLIESAINVKNDDCMEVLLVSAIASRSGREKLGRPRVFCLDIHGKVINGRYNAIFVHGRQCN